MLRAGSAAVVALFVCCVASATHGDDLPAWELTVVDGGGTPDATRAPVSITLDSSGLPHIAYSYGAQLPHDYNYAWYDGEQWQIDTFDEWPHNYGTFSAAISLALDDDDRPHIVYTKVFDPDAELLYAHHDGTAWQIETITDQHNSQYASIKLNNSGRPVVAFYASRDARDLMFAARDGAGQWTIEPVETAGWVGYFCDLELDSEDRPHIAYQLSGSFAVKHAWREADGWHSEVVHDPTDAVGYGLDMAIDSQDRPHISFTANLYVDSLLYSFWDGTQWVSDRIADATRASATAIALDSQDRPHIVYDYAIADGAGPNDHMYITFDGQQWQSTVVDPGYGYGMDHDLVIDAGDQPHVVLGRRVGFYEAYVVYADPVAPNCPGDLNGDGMRDQADLGLLLASYGIDDGGDTDGDGDTDQADLGILLANYAQPCP